MKKIVTITPPDARRGFSCCGVEQHAVPAGEAAETVDGVLADPDSGVMVLDERLLAAVGEERVRELERRWPGVMVVLPAPGGAAPEEDYAVRLIRRAIGYHVRVRK